MSLRRAAGDERSIRNSFFARCFAVDLVWPRLMGGCHVTRDTLAAIQRSGFTVERSRAFVFPPGSRVSVVATKILGVARPTTA